MIELYKVLADSTKIIVVENRFRYQHLDESPIFKGLVFNIPVEVINRRIIFMKPCIIDGDQYIFCEVD